jgi:hypothetical protein
MVCGARHDTRERFFFFFFFFFFLVQFDAVHAYETRVTSACSHLNAVHAVEAADEAVRVGGHVAKVVGQDAPQELVLVLGLGLDHVLAVVAVEEELTRAVCAQSSDTRKPMMGTHDAQGMTRDAPV